jgi:hypothetical protein
VETECVAVEGAPVSKRTIRLTPAGRVLRADHSRLQARLRKRWDARFGVDTVERLRAGLGRILDHAQLFAGVIPHPGGWRASKAYAQRTRALIADPRASLPHNPMVLHCGGWPHGS